jgi:hypothetical protein
MSDLIECLHCHDHFAPEGMHIWREIMFGRRWNKIMAKRIVELEELNSSLYRKQFREGDKVYINDGIRNPLQPVYLRKKYNGNHNYYITSGKDDRIHESMDNAVNVNDISHEKPTCCKACNKQI